MSDDLNPFLGEPVPQDSDSSDSSSDTGGSDSSDTGRFENRQNMVIHWDDI